MTTNGISIDSISTRIGQEDQQQDRQQDQYKNPVGDYYYNYYPARARAREATDAHEEAGELPCRDVMEYIAQAYRDNIGPMITKVAAGIIERALRAGMEPRTVILAIEETGMASRPSPYYLSAVLRRWTETGVVVSRSRGDADISTTAARPWWK